jgi:ribosomal protein S27E
MERESMNAGSNFRRMRSRDVKSHKKRYRRAKIKCPFCGDVLMIDNMFVLPSHPFRPELYHVKCLTCGYEDNAYVKNGD